jgi:hypothetical protein
VPKELRWGMGGLSAQREILRQADPEWVPPAEAWGAVGVKTVDTVPTRAETLAAGEARERLRAEAAREAHGLRAERRLPPPQLPGAGARDSLRAEAAREARERLRAEAEAAEEEAAQARGACSGGNCTLMGGYRKTRRKYRRKHVRKSRRKAKSKRISKPKRRSRSKRI